MNRGTNTTLIKVFLKFLLNRSFLMAKKMIIFEDTYFKSNLIKLKEEVLYQITVKKGV